MSLLCLKQAVQLGINLIYDLSEVVSFVCKVDLVNINDQQGPFIVAADPGLIAFVKALNVVKSQIVFVLAATFLDLINQGGNGPLQVDQQIRWLDQGVDRIENILVILEIPA